MLAITISGLKKTYDKGTVALKGVDLEIPKGSFFGLLGPNGAGKTTLIHSVCGLVEPSGGTITVLGHDAHKNYQYARKHIGLSQQEMVMDPYFKIKDLLIFQARYFGIEKDIAEKRADKLLKQFGIKDKKLSTPREISGGQKRRVEIAKALMHEPDILILDEPTAGLDVETRRDMWEAIKGLNKEGLTVLLTTHYIEEAQELCDIVAIINDGQIIARSNKTDLLDQYAKKTITAHYKAHPKKVAGATRNGNSLHVELSPGDDEAHIIKELQRAGDLASIDTKRQSLEEVFVELTGGKR